MSDLISRQAVLALPIYNEKNLYGNIIREYVDIEDVKQLPPIQPKRGRWKMGMDERFVECSECGLMTTRNELRGLAVFGKNEPNFCPNCGADMRGEQE